MNDARPLYIIALRTILPSLLGAAGAIFAMALPEQFYLFCGPFVGGR